MMHLGKIMFRFKRLLGLAYRLNFLHRLRLNNTLCVNLMV